MYFHLYKDGQVTASGGAQAHPGNTTACTSSTSTTAAPIPTQGSASEMTVESLGT